MLLVFEIPFFSLKPATVGATAVSKSQLQEWRGSGLIGCYAAVYSGFFWSVLYKLLETVRRRVTVVYYSYNVMHLLYLHI